MDRWQNKCAIITGAGSGIGAACSKVLLQNGMIVVGLDLFYERMENEFKSNLPESQRNRFHAIKCDVSNESDVLSAFKAIEEKFGGVDVLINSAGVVRDTQIVKDNNTKDLKDILDVNVLGTAMCTREAFRSMKKHGGNGHIILVNSYLGHKVVTFPGKSFNMYSPSKFAITAMTEVLRHEFLLNETKVKVTSISPGMVDTVMFSESTIPKDTPILKPKDVADAIAYCIQTPPHVQIHELTIRPIGAID